MPRRIATVKTYPRNLFSTCSGVQVHAENLDTGNLAIITHRLKGSLRIFAYPDDALPVEIQYNVQRYSPVTDERIDREIPSLLTDGQKYTLAIDISTIQTTLAYLEEDAVVPTRRGYSPTFGPHAQKKLTSTSKDELTRFVAKVHDDLHQSLEEQAKKSAMLYLPKDF